MRKLKFRAWDKVAKKFLSPWPEGFYILGETTCFDLIGQQLKERSPEKRTLEMLNDVEITQYTGEKDVMGVEIYEEDIVTIPAHYEGDKYYKSTIGRVYYEDGEFKIHGKECGYISLFDFVHNWKGKIIGNIHENPDLLTE